MPLLYHKPKTENQIIGFWYIHPSIFFLIIILRIYVINLINQILIFYSFKFASASANPLLSGCFSSFFILSFLYLLCYFLFIFSSSSSFFFFVCGRMRLRCEIPSSLRRVKGCINLKKGETLHSWRWLRKEAWPKSKCNASLNQFRASPFPRRQSGFRVFLSATYVSL